MTVNWDALVGLSLFLAGTWLLGGPRWAGAVAMVIGLIYCARAIAVKVGP